MQGTEKLPAVADWPRWRRAAGDGALPPDEYFLLSWAPTYECSNPATDSDVGLVLVPQPSWTRIETPKAYRWVGDCCYNPPIPPPPCAGPALNLAYASA